MLQLSKVHMGTSTEVGNSVDCDPGVRESKSGHLALITHEKIAPPVTPEKALGDGYNWRKYGQKLVKGNEFVRSYYKCTHPSCLVKKQLERSHDGHIVDTLYIGTHDHPISLSVSRGVVPISFSEEGKLVDHPTAEAEDKPSDSRKFVSQVLKSPDAPPPKLLSVTAAVSDLPSIRKTDEVDHTDGSPQPKRGKKQNYDNAGATLVDKDTSESRHIVRTTSEVDIVNDGYRWRKYGQKLVKGNQNPRSYYRCSNAGCPMKKHVERASRDPKMVITTYEGQHNHEVPPGRTVTHNTAGLNINNVTSALVCDSYGAVNHNTIGLSTSNATTALDGKSSGAVTHNAVGLITSNPTPALDGESSGTALDGKSSGALTHNAVGLMTSNPTPALDGESSGTVTHNAAELITSIPTPALDGESSGTVTHDAAGLITSIPTPALDGESSGTVTHAAAGLNTSNATAGFDGESLRANSKEGNVVSSEGAIQYSLGAETMSNEQLRPDAELIPN